MKKLVAGRFSKAALLATLPVGLALSCLLIGYEPIGGDPDALYRPIKAELARALRAGGLPFWSDRLGLGVPLIAESHAAAFYPLNWLTYGVLSVDVAYRVLMFVHIVATAITTYVYARRLTLSPRGSALAAVSFALCGFQASHAGHEPIYLALPYLPLCLLASDRCAIDGRPLSAALLSLAWGAQLTLGHFQLQAWTGLLALFLGAWRIAADRRRLRNLVSITIGLLAGTLIAAPQLILTHELTRVSGFRRPFEQLAAYAFPPAHWIQLAWPALFAAQPAGDGSAYWGPLATSAGEATLYIGTIPLTLACIGLLARDGSRLFDAWKVVAALGFILATMPHWWRFGYWIVTCIPILGEFRSPGRYVLLVSLALALFAGRGLDSIQSRSTRTGLALALVAAIASFWWGYTLTQEAGYRQVFGESGVRYRIALGLATWGVALVIIVASQRNRINAWVPIAATSAELIALFFLGPVSWGPSSSSPSQSPILARLATEPGKGLVVGPLEDIPIRAGIDVASPYLGISPPAPTYLLEPTRLPKHSANADVRAWERRLGVTHGIWHTSEETPEAETLFESADPILDRLRGLPESSGRWKIVRYSNAWPAAWVARRAIIERAWELLFKQVLISRSSEDVHYLIADAPNDNDGPRASKARVIGWNGRTAVVEHDGSCDLVIRRAYYPGWIARIDDQPPVPVLKADVGFQAVRLVGSGTNRIEFSYHPTGLAPAIIVSITAIGACGFILIQAALSTRRTEQRAIKQ